MTENGTGSGGPKTVRFKEEVSPEARRKFVNMSFKCWLTALELLWSLRSMTAVVVSPSSVITAVASAIYEPASGFG